MKIALVSFEYPPDTALGGIATYAGQTARMLHRRGHHVEVFAGTPGPSRTEFPDGFPVHRVHEESPRAFAHSIAPEFAARHAKVGFDVLEGPEYHADARGAVRVAPEIPLVLELHTPSWLLLELNCRESSFMKCLSMYVGSAVRGQRPHWGYSSADEGYRAYVEDVALDERAHAGDADLIVSPSESLGQLARQAWCLDPARLVTIPYSYEPSAALMGIPPDTSTNRVTYLGRLEGRKGVVDLAASIPDVLRAVPSARFRFVGAPEPSPDPSLNMREYLEQRLSPHAESVEFRDPIPPSEVPALLAETDICVFPSRWENFPFVCLESMAAARGVVGSSAGGMAEMLDGGLAGRLVPPRQPTRIGAAIVELLRNPEDRIRLGVNARARILAQYDSDRVARLREDAYRRAVEHRKSKGSR